MTEDEEWESLGGTRPLAPTLLGAPRQASRRSGTQAGTLRPSCSARRTPSSEPLRQLRVMHSFRSDQRRE